MRGVNLMRTYMSRAAPKLWGKNKLLQGRQLNSDLLTLANQSWQLKCFDCSIALNISHVVLVIEYREPLTHSCAP